MLVPHEIAGRHARSRGIPPGWWAATQDGAPIFGPYASRETALAGIAKRGENQPTGRPGEDPVPRPE
ncbi:hypothetical protein [Roseixanthobacter liquoris]|uniref:hypothetical protein n=1 Tax=Roseixanthobacter liquoris TaxID=3119921 RepID=UPI00372C8B0A